MAHDIKKLANSSETCQEMKPRNTQELLKQHSEGDGPWQTMFIRRTPSFLPSLGSNPKNMENVFGENEA